MNGRPPTIDEKFWMDKVAQLPCVVCKTTMGVDSLAAIHHMRGKTCPDAHLFTIPLCAKHHQEKDNHKPARWVSRHGDGRRAFERAYGKEDDLLWETIDMVAALQEDTL